MFPFLPESHDESNYGPPEMMISPTVAAASLPGYFMASFFPMEMAGAPRTDHIPMDRAVLASRNHREAEKRRRERIKSHLDRLRAILSCDPKVCVDQVAFEVCLIKLAILFGSDLGRFFSF